MRQIQLDKNATGGGLGTLSLTEFEKRAVNIAGMETSVHGLQGAVFGIPANENNNQEEDVVNAESINTTPITANATPTNTAVPQRRSVLRKRVTTQALVLKELKEQRAVMESFSKSIIGLLTESNDINKRRMEIEEEKLQLKKSKYQSYEYLHDT